MIRSQQSSQAEIHSEMTLEDFDLITSRLYSRICEVKRMSLLISLREFSQTQISLRKPKTLKQ